MSRARQRRRAVALWRYEKRLEALNAVRLSHVRPALWLDDKPVWLALHPRRYTGAISGPRPARAPRWWRRLPTDVQDRVLTALTRASVRWLYGPVGLGMSAFRLPSSGA